MWKRIKNGGLAVLGLFSLLRYRTQGANTAGVISAIVAGVKRPQW